MNLKHCLLVGLVILSPLAAGAQADYEKNKTSTSKSFRQFVNIELPLSNVPVVAEIFVDDLAFERAQFRIEDSSLRSQPYFYKEDVIKNKYQFISNVYPANSNIEYLLDDNIDTYTDFDLYNANSGQVVLDISSVKMESINGVSLLLDQFVELPTGIKVEVVENGVARIVLAMTRMDSTVINFPETLASAWRVTLNYAQPLRIREISMIGNRPSSYNTKRIRFLAQPSSAYKLYYNADRYVPNSKAEMGQLGNVTDVVIASKSVPLANTQFVVADSDSDGIADFGDNCPNVANANQVDLNRNKMGDECEDFDVDGIINDLDNCQNIPNSNQRDTDGDNIGDVCDKEESRLTEKHAWLPWVGIGLAGTVVVVLIALTAMHKPENNN